MREIVTPDGVKYIAFDGVRIASWQNAITVWSLTGKWADVQMVTVHFF
jgi:hypothetical protein